jgi:quercetin dioxygenase-like cupin family protein
MPAPLTRSALRAGALAAALGLAAGIALGRTTYPPLVFLLKAGNSVLGQPFAYPEGQPQVTAAIVTLMPGQETGWHRHEVPLLGYILEGALTVDYGPAGSRTYEAGDAFLEAFGSDHDGRNAGDAAMRLLAVYMGAEDVPNTVMRGD